MHDFSKASFAIAGMIAAWAILVGLGWQSLTAYHATPGASGAPPVDWPGSSLVFLDRSRPTLLCFIHPRCPCSRASQAELARVVARFRDKVTVQVVTYTPGHSTDDWDRIIHDGDPSIPDSVRILDRGGREAERFGVRTSGHVLLFGTNGRRLFSGGITLSRGHEGPNPGADRLIEAILGQTDQPGSIPVFGCPFNATAAIDRPESDR